MERGIGGREPGAVTVCVAKWDWDEEAKGPFRWPGRRRLIAVRRGLAGVFTSSQFAVKFQFEGGAQ